MTDPAPPTRRTLALFTLGVAAFTLYGSLVPLTFRALPAADARDAFARGMARWRVASRVDGAVNVLLGVPLGFGLLGLCRLDRPGGWRRDAAVGLALLPAGGLFAAAVEGAQVFVRGRTCAGADVLCQVAGAAVGMAGWAAGGRWLVARLRVVGRRVDGEAGRLLAGYTLLVVVVQALPLDLDPSPRDLYRKARDRAGWEPFAEFRGADADRAWKEAAKVAEMAGLFLPAGLLAARLGRRGRWTAALLMVGVAVGTELVQLGVESRFPRATDAVAGAGGVAAGWAVGRAVGRPGAGLAVLLAAVWTGVLLGVYWQPFRFRTNPSGFDWVPGHPLHTDDPLLALQELLTKAILFAPLGVLAGGRRTLAGAVGLGVAVAVEVGQLGLPGRTPGVTDVLVGGAGALAGAWAVRRLRRPAGG